MDAKTRRKLAKEEMRKRQDESYKKKDDSGRFKTIFNDKFPADKKFKCGEGEHSLDFIPFVAGSNNPNVKEGKLTYILDVWVHNKVGINEDSYICMNKTFAKPCSICNYQAELIKREEDDDIVKALNPTRRGIYNIWCHDNPKEEAKGVQIWDVSHWLFESNVIEQAKLKKGGGYIYYTDIDDGKVVSFRRTGSGATNTKFVAITFEDREETLPDEIVMGVYNLDELLHIPTFEEVETAFFGKAKGEKEKKSERKEEPIPPEQTSEEGDVPEELGEPVCPSDYVFGVDFGDYDECDDCEVRKDCRAKKRELKEPKKEEELRKEEEKRDPEPRRRRR